MPNQRIVIINDDENVIELMARLLQHEGYSVATFTSAVQAVEQLQHAKPPALIITDIYMPGMDGWHLCRLLRSPAYRAFHKVPILVVSATFAGHDIEQLTANMGANAFLQLPLQRPVFIQLVQQLIENKRPLPQHSTTSTAAQKTLRQAEQLLSERTRQFYLQSMALDQVNDFITITDLEGNITYINDAVCRTLGRTREELLGKNVAIYGENAQKGATQAEILEHTRSAGGWRGEVVNYTADGREIILECRTQLLRDSSGKAVALVGFSNDITARKQMELQLKQALQEKEILLRELYHRTKNNMQVICSMLTLHAAHAETPEVAAAFHAMEQRLQAMVLAHQKMHQAQNPTEIDLHNYLADLGQLLLQSYRHPGKNIAFSAEIAPVRVLLDVAIPCGLIVNELIINSIKHAFTKKTNGSIQLEIKALPQTGLEIVFQDNGCGLPPDFSPEKHKTIGLQTILAIVKQQLRGQIEIADRNGLYCRIVLPEIAYTLQA